MSRKKAVPVVIDDELHTHMYNTTKAFDDQRDLVIKWARWRQGQCDFPKGLSDEEKALYELVEKVL